MGELLLIEGGKCLEGDIYISGSKNASLPTLAATLLSSDEIILENLPRLKDVCIMLELLRDLGCSIINGDDYIINSSNCSRNMLPEKSQLIRASILFASPLVSRLGSAKLLYPGGCNIGIRKIDIHLNGLISLGAEVKVHSNYIQIEARRLVGTDINLPFPSVGATENILMAACLADGQTILSNCSIEPEVIEFEQFLKQMGAKIEGIGSRQLKIEGVDNLNGLKYKIMPDRIEAATYAIASAITRGNCAIKNIDPDIMKSLTGKLKEMGVNIKTHNDFIEISADMDLKPVDIVTEVYPGFPTDMHPILTPLLCLCKGNSTIRETIYENRFQYISQLLKLGAKIDINNDTILIKGVEKFKSAKTFATDLRGGAALVIAGLSIDDKILIENVGQIDRGYEFIDKKLNSVGANIKRI